MEIVLSLHRAKLELTLLHGVVSPAVRAADRLGKDAQNPHEGPHMCEPLRAPPKRKASAQCCGVYRSLSFVPKWTKGVISYLKQGYITPYRTGISEHFVERARSGRRVQVAPWNGPSCTPARAGPGGQNPFLSGPLCTRVRDGPEADAHNPHGVYHV